MGDLSEGIERPGMERMIDSVTFLLSMAGQSTGRSQGGGHRRARARGADSLHPKRLISESISSRGRLAVEGTTGPGRLGSSKIILAPKERKGAGCVNSLQTRSTSKPACWSLAYLNR